VSGDDERIAAWRAVLLAQSRVVRAIDADLDHAGLVPLTWYDVLLELNAAPGRQLRMQQLGLRTVLSRTRCSRLVTELEAEGLVERAADPDDGRATLARITDQGRTALRRAAPVYLRGISEHFSSYLSPAEQQAITNGLQKVIDAHTAAIDPRR
jgi:DNA-binding MarR family transcriptional regulator